jgi:hypothetical protein
MEEMGYGTWVCFLLSTFTLTCFSSFILFGDAGAWYGGGIIIKGIARMDARISLRAIASEASFGIDMAEM